MTIFSASITDPPAAAGRRGDTRVRGPPGQVRRWSRRSYALASAHVRDGHREERESQCNEDEVPHSGVPHLCESKVTMAARMKSCCRGVSATAPGPASPSLKKPPSAP